MIRQAALLAEKWHHGQLRKYTGRPYIEHPGRVAMRVTLARGSEAMIAAAWLHDVLEDTACPPWQIGAATSVLVWQYVADLTNPSKQHKNLPRAERKKMDRLHLMDCRDEVKIIKLLDRYDNLLDMTGSDNAFLKLYLEESEELVNAIGKVDTNISNLLYDQIAMLARTVDTKSIVK